LIAEVGFAQAYSFKYSARPGTPAADHPSQVPEEVKSARLSALQSLLTQQQTAFNAACLGQQFPVLLTGTGRHAGQMTGRSPYLQPVHVNASSDVIGMIVNVEIIGLGTNSLAGEIVDSTHATHLTTSPLSRAVQH
jgi:tRNA-2-methylthio-N6-dimethylallyladenosine synthase